MFVQVSWSPSGSESAFSIQTDRQIQQSARFLVILGLGVLSVLRKILVVLCNVLAGCCTMTYRCVVKRP